MKEETLDKFVFIEKEIAREKGGFALFGLFLREDSPNKWDIVVSASWFGKSRKKTLDFIAEKISSKLKPQEMIMLSRIVLLDPSSDFVKQINQFAETEHKRLFFAKNYVNDVEIQTGWIITSKPAEKTVAGEDTKPVFSPFGHSPILGP